MYRRTRIYKKLWKYSWIPLIVFYVSIIFLITNTDCSWTSRLAMLFTADSCQLASTTLVNVLLFPINLITSGIMIPLFILAPIIIILSYIFILKSFYILYHKRTIRILERVPLNIIRLIYVFLLTINVTATIFTIRYVIDKIDFFLI